jgi:dolichyl-phosphate beta-glucosyltransferase
MLMWGHSAMSKPTYPISLVTPVWNDTARLAVFGKELARALALSPLPIQWIIADDGSTLDAPGRLQALRDEFAAEFPAVTVHFATAHHGKGAVLREAWALTPDADWLAFVDADGSVSAEDFLNLIAHAVAHGKSVIAVRKRTATTELVESPWRGLAHRSFLWIARQLLGLQSEDIQCGAKVFSAADYRKISARLKETGLAFDSELLANFHQSGSDWLEVPVNWTEKKGGKVKPLRDGCRMFCALLRIRQRLR